MLYTNSGYLHTHLFFDDMLIWGHPVSEFSTWPVHGHAVTYGVPFYKIAPLSSSSLQKEKESQWVVNHQPFILVELVVATSIPASWYSIGSWLMHVVSNSLRRFIQGFLQIKKFWPPLAGNLLLLATTICRIRDKGQWQLTKICTLLTEIKFS